MYAPIAPQTDDRLQKKGALPTVLRNCMVDIAPAATQRRSQYFICPTPGRTLRATLQDNCRGLFSEPGCVSGNLFAPAGGMFNQVFSNWGMISTGTITGADDVEMVPFQSSVAALALGLMYLWDGSTFTQITDGDAPNPALTLASVAFRLVAAVADGTGFGWSTAGAFNAWDPAGTAADIYLPDIIVNQFELSGSLFSFNQRSTQEWQPTGGAESEAFALVPSTTRIGLAAKGAITRTGDGLIFVGHDRRVYRASPISPISNRDIETALAALTATEMAAVRCWSYTQESKIYACVNAGLERAWVYDVDLGLWHERSHYGDDVYDIDFATAAFDNASVVVASATTDALWTLDRDVYTDAGTLIEREMTIHVPVQGDAPINRIVLDAEFRDQPTTGQGVAPVIMLSVSLDGGDSWCDERMLSLPALGDYGVRVQDFCFGLALAEWGALIKLRITDPIFFAVYGCWINPSPQEVP